LTQFGAFNPNPLPGEQLIPRNYGPGPNQFTVNMRLSRTWSSVQRREAAAIRQRGPRPGGGGPRMMGGGPPMEVAVDAAVAALAAAVWRRHVRCQCDKRFNLTPSISARNVLNHTTGTPIAARVRRRSGNRIRSAADGRARR
jgi:hypothetical protein